MTFLLANAIEQVELPSIPGVSPHALRIVFKAMARHATDDRTGHLSKLRGCWVAEIADLSVSTTRRAQRALVKLGLLVKEKVGGGHKATEWRVGVDKLAEMLRSSGHTKGVALAQRLFHGDTAHVVSTSEDPSKPRPPRRGFPGKNPRRPWVPQRATAPDRRTVDQSMCATHPHFPAGTTSAGTPACPRCRHHEGVSP